MVHMHDSCTIVNSTRLADCIYVPATSLTSKVVFSRLRTRKLVQYCMRPLLIVGQDSQGDSHSYSRSLLYTKHFFVAYTYTISICIHRSSQLQSSSSSSSSYRFALYIRLPGRRTLHMHRVQVVLLWLYV